MQRLVGKRVHVLVSDPWEFAKPNGSTRFVARIVETRAGAGSLPDALLIVMTDSVFARGHEWRYFTAVARGGGPFLDGLVAGDEADCALYGMLGGDVPPAPMDTATWRGGLAAIAQLRLM